MKKLVMVDSETVENETPPPSEEEPRSPKKADTISKKIIKNGEMGIIENSERMIKQSTVKL